MASPHAAGVVALYLGQHPDASPKKVAQAIRQQSRKHKLTGVGPQTVNRLLYSLVH